MHPRFQTEKGKALLGKPGSDALPSATGFDHRKKAAASTKNCPCPTGNSSHSEVIF